MKGIEFTDGEWGTRGVIRGEWHDSFLDILLKNQTMELELNDGKGWHGTSVEFLRDLPQLKSLVILRLPLKSLEPIHFLHNLISLNVSTYSKTPVNFLSFPRLISCGFEWIKGSDSLFECKSLRGLGLNNYKGAKSSIFKNLVNLEKLTLLNANVEDLEGIFELQNLAYLSISNLKNVSSLRGIEKLQNLEEFEIQRCKGIQNVSEIFKLEKLKRLLILDSGAIESVQGIENLSSLEEFLFYESTNILDGDLSPILKLKDLKKISFQNRRHYSHRREDFGKLYA